MKKASHQVRLCVMVPRRVQEFFRTETERLSERDQMPWTHGRLLTRLVDEHLRRKPPSPNGQKVE